MSDRFTEESEPASAGPQEKISTSQGEIGQSTLGETAPFKPTDNDEGLLVGAPLPNHPVTAAMERYSPSFSLSSTDENRSRTDLSQTQVHRLLSLLGGALSLYLGFLYAANNPDATVPSGAVGVTVAVLFAGLLAVSYGSTVVRRQYAVGMRAVLYAVLV